MKKSVHVVSTPNADTTKVLSIIVQKAFSKFVVDKVSKEHPNLPYEQAKPFLDAEYARHLLPGGQMALTIIGDSDDLVIVSQTGEVIL